jgi:hypothetical protein
MFKRIISDQKFLFVTGALSLATLIVLTMLSLFDSAEILGINRWTKPMKFALSIWVYLWTLAVYLYFVPGRGGTKKVIGYGASLLLAGELVLITMQAARGTTSHFNNNTAFDGMVFSAMGLMIVVNTALIAYLLVVYFRAGIELPRSILWGMRLGVILFLLASLEGGYISVVMQHTVGAADGGPGLPFFNWSKAHGDLRVAHFIGMHALQAVPVFAWVINKLRPAAATALTFVFGFSYLLIFTAFFVQALIGWPLFANGH